MKKNIIRYGQQEITKDDIESVVDTLLSNNLTQGPKNIDFENSVKNFTNARHAFAVNSATSALHISCLALGLGPGDILWTSPNSFVASSNCALYCGASVSFVDIDPDTYNMCPTLLEKKLIDAKKKDQLPKIVVPVHLAGQSCDMKAIHELSKTYGFKVIEDGSHAIGGMYKNEPVGNCKYSDITVFSFHPVKIITTGEGGMALTNSDSIAEKLGLFRSHGITRDENLMTKESDGSWYYQQIALGFNYRMTDIQASLGHSQMNRLSQYINRRQELAKRYNKLLNDFPLKLPFQSDDCYSSFHLYIIRLNLDEISVTHESVFESFRDNNIMVNLHYIPIHLQPFYQDMGFSEGDYPEAEKYYSEAISIPLHPSLSFEDQDLVVELLRKFLRL
ncbi:UDP-4-amino-4,6-dideoxy-N-acetyl-beta-L-altrosamine transaminase [Gammaproteobacteria bacterium]|nr:UDP-4-amino-4,6-dideoxy-N-acetyl-beta-L-altrosamine transaminase [Gammaproteobacteria bacterium]